ncbi:MAG: hypothetical protein K6L73_10870 [Cellvibrionaceae bacterium]
MKSIFKKQKLALAVILAGSTLTGCDSDSDVSINNPDLDGGKVLLYTTAGEYIDTANVGNLPDSVKFVSATSLVVANEGEPEDDYVADAEGSISIITLSSDKTVVDVTTLGFSDDLLVGDVRIKPDSTAAADLEPEYIAVNEAGDTAWVTLQENNAVAIVDIANKSISEVKSLGKVTVANQAMDIIDDGVANPVMGNPANIFALYMPDTIVSYNVGGSDYYVTANEGDDREYGDYEDLEKANELDLSAELEAVVVTPDMGMEKLRVLADQGDTNSDGIYEELYLTGTRSFTIWGADGNVVFDSGAEFEEEVAATLTAYFNTRVDDTDDADDIQELIDDGVPYEMHGDTAYFWEGVDARSLKKGVEPEALAVHAIGDKVFAYIGLEKQGGFFVYDVTTPASASMVEYFNDIDYTQLPSTAGDLAPEGMVTFEQDGSHYLVVANELSSSLSVFELATDGTVTKLASLSVGAFDKGAAEIVDYSSEDKALFVTNAETSMVDIIDISTPASPSVSSSIDFSEHASDVQSVSVKDGVLAIAVK